ncbi:MAG: hypothetical protein J6V37_00115 [Clostridia bacterium]|nr:hypothetical protein [Clostridia bacterium]
MKKCSICNSENVRNYPFELGFITSHIPNEDGVLPVNPKFNICMDCGHVFITDMAAVDTIKKMDKISTAVKTEKDKFVAKAKETVATVEAKIKEIEAKIIAIEAQIVAKAVEEKVKAELTAAKEKLQSELKATQNIKERVVSAYEAIKAKVAGITTTATPATEATEEAPVEASTIDTTPAEEKEPIINPEAVNSIKNAFSAGKSFLKKAFAKTESTDETTAE